MMKRRPHIHSVPTTFQSCQTVLQKSTKILQSLNQAHHGPTQPHNGDSLGVSPRRRPGAHHHLARCRSFGGDLVPPRRVSQSVNRRRAPLAGSQVLHGPGNSLRISGTATPPRHSQGVTLGAEHAHGRFGRLGNHHDLPVRPPRAQRGAFLSTSASIQPSPHSIWHFSESCSHIFGAG